MVRHENDVHNSSKTIFISLKKTFISFFTNGANRPGVNRPVRKMVLERIVPGGTGFGANRPVTPYQGHIPVSQLQLFFELCGQHSEMSQHVIILCRNYHFFIISIPNNVSLNVHVRVRCKLWLLLGVDLSVITDACKE